MVPLINGKEIGFCSEDDLSVLIDNPDFRENEELEYKKCFDYLTSENKADKEKKKVEFKCDVCSFANTKGGVIIYGVIESSGCASSLEGIDIDDTDKFELNRRNDLNGIQPRTPNVDFKFIPLKTGKYIVVLHIKNDGFAPYVYLENEKDYRIYRRFGNGKSVIGYTELRQMFNQSLSLEKSIYDFVFDRIKHYLTRNSKCGDKFIFACVIPETFKDPHYRHNVFLMERNKGIRFDEVFNSLCHLSSSIPCVDGIRYIPWSEETSDYVECYVKNSGIVEACISIEKTISNNFMPWEYLWEKIECVYINCIQNYRKMNFGERIFLCISIIGCQGVETDTEYGRDYVGHIDRNEVICDPILVDIDDTDDIIQKRMKQLYLEFLLSIGVKYKKQLKDLIKELQDDEG